MLASLPPPNSSRTGSWFVLRHGSFDSCKTCGKGEVCRTANGDGTRCWTHVLATGGAKGNLHVSTGSSSENSALPSNSKIAWQNPFVEDGLILWVLDYIVLMSAEINAIHCFLRAPIASRNCLSYRRISGCTTSDSASYCRSFVPSFGSSEADKLSRWSCTSVYHAKSQIIHKANKSRLHCQRTEWGAQEHLQSLAWTLSILFRLRSGGRRKGHTSPYSHALPLEHCTLNYVRTFLPKTV